MFISFNKPYNVVTKDTIARWIKTILKLAGIDIATFKPHSTRAASSSAAKRLAVPLSSIMRAASWKTDSTFRRFYDKPIDTERDYAKTILNKPGK